MAMLHDIWQAPTLIEANKAFDQFIETFKDKYDKATDCLAADCESLLTYYHFPAANWCHIRTTNPIESTFATIRLRHKKTRGCGSTKASLKMLFKLAQSTEKGWRKLRGHDHFPDLLQGKKFVDGLSEEEYQAQKLKSTTPQNAV